MSKQRADQMADNADKSDHPIMINSILNCDFEYQCNLDWDRLEETGNDFLRHCNTCNRDVELCIDQQAIDAALDEGRCIAYPIYTPEMVEKIKAYELGSGDFPFQDIRMPMGLPKRK